MVPVSWITTGNGQLRGKNASRYPLIERNLLQGSQHTIQLLTLSEKPVIVPPAWPGTACSLLPVSQYQENIRLTPSHLPGEKRPLAVVPSKATLEIGRKRPRSRLDSNGASAITLSGSTESEHTSSNHKGRPAGLSKRVFSRVKDGMLRSKSVSKRRASDKTDHSQQLTFPTFPPVERVQNPCYAAASPNSFYSMQTSMGNSTEEHPDHNSSSPCSCSRLYIKTAFDIDSVQTPGVTDFWVKIKVSAVGPVTDHDTVDLCRSHYAELVNITLKVKARAGFRLLQTIGPTEYHRLAAGESFVILLNVAHPRSCSTLDGDSVPVDNTIDDLCSEIESLLSPEADEIEFLIVKLEYSDNVLPNDTSLVLRRSLTTKSPPYLPVSIASAPESRTSPRPAIRDSAHSLDVKRRDSHSMEGVVSESACQDGEHEDGEAHSIWRQIRQVSRSADHPFALKPRGSPPLLDRDRAVEDLAALARVNRRSSLGQETIREWRASSDGNDNAVIGGPWL